MIINRFAANVSANDINKSFFTGRLMRWNREVNDREMPWKGEKDPYRIWLSEIILQQTRVDQGRNYYNRFIAAYPDITSLSQAPEQEVFKLWEGLGYYSRCRNLIATAKTIALHHGGRFPDTYNAILGLKGVGPYTAAAIASFAYNLPHAVVDGNVVRVLSRFFGIDANPQSSVGKMRFKDLSNELIPKKEPAVYNQAIMDFGATVCKPVSPICGGCVLWTNCFAFNTGTVGAFPLKVKKSPKKRRWLNYLIFDDGENVLVRLRSGKDIWQNLYEFFLIETESIVPVSTLIVHENINEILPPLSTHKQLLSHQVIQAQFILCRVDHLPLKDGYQAYPKSLLHQLPFPKIAREYLQHTPV